MKFKDEKKMVEAANNSEYGLTSSVFSKDRDRAEKIGRELDTGGVFINEMSKSDSRLPFGGTKMSGYGRDCSEFGTQEFTNIKTFYINWLYNKIILNLINYNKKLLFFMTLSYISVSLDTFSAETS